MTTGCICGKSGCGGLAHDRGGRCPRCEIEAIPAGAGRVVRQIIHTALNGPDMREREAGS